MKTLNKVLLAAFSIVCLAHCKSKAQNEAEQAAMNIVKTMDETSPESKANTSGFYMKATIDGKKWEATKMTPDYSADASYKLIHGETPEITLTYNLYMPETGKKIEFSNEEMITLMTDNGIFSGKKGELIVTDANDKWIEGKFHFTATSSSLPKVIEVKDGSFRVAMPSN
jgi:hypothetical protein